VTEPHVAADRLSPERQIRLYSNIARKMVKAGQIGVALAAMHAVQDAIAVLQEHAGNRR
jgi:hypothetical protein